MIRFWCECGRQLQATWDNVGRPATCPICGKTTTVPDGDRPRSPWTGLSGGRGEFTSEPSGPQQGAHAPRSPRGTQPSGLAKASLVFGILSFLVVVIGSIAAITTGILALRKIGRSQGKLTGKGNALAGLILGCLGLGMVPVLYYGVGYLRAWLSDEPDPNLAQRRSGKDSDPFTGKPTKKVQTGTNVWLEMAGGKRRVLVSARVCLRQGGLEQFLTRKGKKEHEAILAADVDARLIHVALTTAGATPGSPVQFTPVYRPATGTVIRVSVIYMENGVEKVVPAQSWIRNAQTGKELDTDWVFAGSILTENPLDETAPKMYLANEGDVICVANFSTALLDLPIPSSAVNSERNFEAWTERIPPLGTRVVVALEPVLPRKKKAE
jgi:hypothetical protein